MLVDCLVINLLTSNVLLFFVLCSLFSERRTNTGVVTLITLMDYEPSARGNPYNRAISLACFAVATGNNKF